MSGSSGPSVGQSTAPREESRQLEIFISYRREDAAANAGRLADALVNRFGRDSVFMDVDTIEPGADYTEVIDRAVGHCDVLIALIGPHWLDASNSRGRRLDDPQDLVRLEIRSALSRNIRVIPTLVGGARMPDAEELPGELASLSKRNAVELSHVRFQSDLQLLLKPLEKIAEQKGTGRLADTEVLAPKPPTAPVPSAPIPGPSRPQLTAAPIRIGRGQLIAGALALVLLIGLGGWIGLSRLAPNAVPNLAPAAATWPNSYVGTWKGTGHEFSPPADFAVTVTLKPGNVGQNVGHMDRPTLGCSTDLTLDKATAQAITMTEQGGGCGVSGQDVTGKKVVMSRKGATLDWKEYPGDPSSNSAMASATLAEGTGSTVPGTTTLLTVPDGFLGTWRGTGHESTPSDDFAITMIVKAGEVGETVATISRPTLGCSADLTLDKATAQAITLSEVRAGGCATGGQDVTGSKILLSLASGVIGWKEYPGDPSATSAIATATLAQGSSGAIAGTPNLLGVPDTFIGTWKGTGHESSPSGDFAITVIIRAGQLGETVATMDRPSLGCRADLVLDRATAQSIVLNEQRAGGCALAGQDVTGQKLLLVLTGTSIDWKEFPGDPTATSAIASATLAGG